MSNPNQRARHAQNGGRVSSAASTTTTHANANGNGNGNGTNSASALMRTLGSRDGKWSPEANDWWLYDLRHAKSADTRLMALLKSCTTARRNPKPWATDDMGKPVDYAFVAARLDWTERTARNEMSELVSSGRALIDEHGRFRLCADVPLAHVAPEDGDTCETKDPKTYSSENWDEFVQSHFSGYLADSVKAVPREKQDSFIRKWLSYEKYAPEIKAEAVLAVRIITERHEDSILGEFGVKRARLPKRQAERQQRALKWIKFEEANQPEFVQSQSSDSVQSQNQVCTDPKNGLYTPENGSVQTDASLLSLQTQTQTRVTGSSSSSEAVCTTGQPGADATTTKPSDQAPVTAFSDALLALFTQAGKPAPTAKQIVEVYAILPAGAHHGYLHSLARKMKRVEHGGVLATDARTFAQQWTAGERIQQQKRAATAKGAETIPCPACGGPMPDPGDDTRDVPCGACAAEVSR